MFTTLNFSGNVPGPEGEACGVTSPIDCFRLLLPSTYIDELLDQINLYADQQRATKNDRSPFVPIVKEELLAFIEVNIAMGVVSLYLRWMTTGQPTRFLHIHGFTLYYHVIVSMRF